MSLVSEFRAQLEATGVFRLVAGAPAFASLTGEPKAMPAAFVMIEEEQSDDNTRATGPVLQRTEADVAVIIINKNVSDNAGGAAAEEIETLKAVVRRALIGFVPAASVDGTPVTHISGNLLRARGGVVWHRELFAAATYQEAFS